MDKENKSDIHVHIVSFDMPFPASYGGVIDVFYKGKSLANIGIKVHLHCFEHGGKRSPELEKLFFEVKYYPLNTSRINLLKRTPFIVEMRRSKELVSDLLMDDYPIIMEGLHTTFLLSDKRFKNRKLIVRIHNIEHEYFKSLYKVESNWRRKLYFFLEAAKLKKYENQLMKSDFILAISRTDFDYFSNRHPSVMYLPAFHSNTKINSKTGKGTYALYHGNLAVSENSNGATRLINEVFQDSGIPFKIAGNKPPSSLRRLVEDNPNVELISDPDDETLNDLIRNAHVNILYTDQATGLKLKLLNAVYNGRFLLANDKMLKGSNLEALCIVANTTLDMKSKLIDIMKKDFPISMIEERRNIVEKLYGSDHNAHKLMEILA